MPNEISLLLIADDTADEQAVLAGARSAGLPYRFDVARTVAEASRLIPTGAHALILVQVRSAGENTSHYFDLLEGRSSIFITEDDEAVGPPALPPGVRDYVVKDPGQKYLKRLWPRVALGLRLQAAEKRLRESETSVVELAAVRRAQSEKAHWQ